jgi:serine/threonine-protein kinase
MKTERWQQIEKLYYAALELAESRRAAFLDQACAADEALRREVESLLASHQEASGFLSSPALEVEAKMVAAGEAKAGQDRMKYCPRCQQTYPETQRFCSGDRTPLSFQDPYHLVGRILVGKYRIDALVGVGGMGAVYRAYQLGIERRVAFKILQPNIALSNKRTIELFEREAKVAGRLSHENIATVYDSGRTPDGIAYIAMEWLDGRTLHEELAASGPLGFERAAWILRQIAAALDEAHARHIIHRDLKPSNVMIVKRAGASWSRCWISASARSSVTRWVRQFRRCSGRHITPARSSSALMGTLTRGQTSIPSGSCSTAC